MIDADPARAPALARALENGGLTSAVAAAAGEVAAAFRAVPAPSLAWVTTSAEPAAVRSALAHGAPFVVVLDETPCPSALLELAPLGFVAAAQAPREMAAALLALLRRELDRSARCRWEQAARDASAAMLLLDAEGRVVAVNRGYAHLAGGVPRDVEGEPIGHVVHVGAEGEASEPERAAFGAAVRGEATWAGDVRFVGGASIVPCRAAITRYTDAGGGPLGVIVVLVDATDVQVRATTLRETNDRLLAQSKRDTLVDAFNRNHMVKAMQQELARAARYERPFAFLVADLDRFREVNNTLGLRAGDEVLREVAKALGGALRARAGDVLVRYGGDEFCVLLPETPPAEARAVAERLLAVVRGIRTSGPHGRPMTISAGLASTSDPALQGAASVETLFDLANVRMRLAKDQGGDRVVDEDPPPPPREVAPLLRETSA